MLSIIICSIDPAKFTAVSRNLAALLGDEPHEIIGVHDAKSLCEGYNRGAARASGEWFIFCHDDIEILSADFRQKLKRHMQSFDVFGVAGTDRVVNGLWSLAGPPYIHGQIAHFHPHSNEFDVSLFSAPARSVGKIQAIDGLFIAARREVVEKVPFDQETFDGFHAYDTDFTFSAYLAGFRLGVACDIAILHASVGNPDKVWQHYMQKFNRKHLCHLYPMPRRAFTVASVRVQTREEVIEVMTPPYWRDSD